MNNAASDFVLDVRCTVKTFKWLILNTVTYIYASVIYILVKTWDVDNETTHKKLYRIQQIYNIESIVISKIY